MQRWQCMIPNNNKRVEDAVVFLGLNVFNADKYYTCFQPVEMCKSRFVAKSQ